MNKLILLFASLLFASAALHAQDKKVEIVKRIEIDRKETDLKSFNIVNLEEGGLIQITSEYSPSKSVKWTITKLDKDFEVVAKKDITLPKKMYFDTWEKTKNHLFIYFQSRKRKYNLISFNLSTMKTTSVEGEVRKKTKFQKSAIIGDFLVFSSKTKRETFLTLINWKTGKTKEIPIEIKDNKAKRIFFTQMQILKDESELFVFVRADKEKELYALRLDKQGRKKKLFCLTKKYDEVISSISVLKSGENEYVYTGTYSGNAYSSSGIFIGKSKGNSVSFIENYNFLNLNNFLSYLSERKIKKIEKKKRRKAKRGKELTYSYSIASHDLIKKGDKYIYIGEAYYATYKTVSRTSRNSDGTSSTTYEQVFDGYQYTHAVIACYDQEGNMLWDNTFELNYAYKPKYIKRFISLTNKDENEEQISFVYSSGNKIHHKIINTINGRTVKESETNEIGTKDDADKIKWSLTESDYWYGNYFITYGYQKVKNKEGKKKKRRKIYFINKIKY